MKNSAVIFSVFAAFCGPLFAQLPAAPSPDIGRISKPPAVLQPQPARAMNEGELLAAIAPALVVIEGGGGAGSGFVARWKNETFLITNQHVVSKMPTVTARSITGAALRFGAGQAAVGHDVMRFPLTTAPQPMELIEDFDAQVRIGDRVAVLGNSEGAGVMTPLYGRLLGIGPDRIEVDAQFVPGNSGSPILHLPSGKVIGIATYLSVRQTARFTDDRESRVRRFGYRLDSIAQWQPVNWAAYLAEAKAMARIEQMSKDLIRLVTEMDRRIPSAVDYDNSQLQRALRQFNDGLTKNGSSQADRRRVVQGFFADIRASTTGDINQARATMRYDFFRRSLAEESAGRGELYKAFDELVKNMR